MPMVIGRASDPASGARIEEKGKDPVEVRVAEMCCCLGSTPRLKIVQLLLTAYPQGMVVENIRKNLKIAASTLSHHLHKLKVAGLLDVEREGPFLWYSINVKSFEGMLTFLYQECCCKNKVLDRGSIVAVDATTKMP